MQPDLLTRSPPPPYSDNRTKMEPATILSTRAFCFLVAKTDVQLTANRRQYVQLPTNRTEPLNFRRAVISFFF
jgi:hypothetical protein